MRRAWALLPLGLAVLALTFWRSTDAPPATEPALLPAPTQTLAGAATSTTAPSFAVTDLQAALAQVVPGAELGAALCIEDECAATALVPEGTWGLDELQWTKAVASQLPQGMHVVTAGRTAIVYTGAPGTPRSINPTALAAFDEDAAQRLLRGEDLQPGEWVGSAESRSVPYDAMTPEMHLTLTPEEREALAAWARDMDLDRPGRADP
ncbi:MAG: hypothetical protein KTR31_01935 [Myxococcales bacterium]|nr:hypothetical protein [Myxococcales bacterium]